jgi:hypothetical protein
VDNSTSTSNAVSTIPRMRKRASRREDAPDGEHGNRRQQ